MQTASQKSWGFSLLQRLKAWIDFQFAPKVHQKKISKANDVLKKIRGINGEFREPKILSYLRKIDPFVFEELLLTALERSGHKIQRNKAYTSDGGIDGIFYKNGQPVYIQAKRYSDHIKVEDVTKFIEKVNSNKVRGLFIHTGKTGDAVWSKIRYSSVEIVSGNKLISMLTQ